MGEDSWLARSNNNATEPGTSEARNSNGKPRRNRHKRRSNGDNTDDTTVNAGFSGSTSGQRKKPYKRNNQGSSSLDRILDRPCQIHDTTDKLANHTNRGCSVFRKADKLNAEHKEKEPQSDDDEEEPRPPNIWGQKKFPPKSRW